VQWPKEILDAFDRALTIEPAPGMDKLGVIRALLDETARRAAWRAHGKAEHASAALRAPYTPLGSVVNDGVNGLARSLGFRGDLWGKAVDLLHGYIEHNAAAVFAAFGGQRAEYPDDVGMGSGRDIPD
jgi:hypothetical protein